MPFGDSQRAWLPEMLAELREFWTPDVEWESLIGFCETMTALRSQLRQSKGIRDAVIYCPLCKERHPAKLIDVTPRSALFALQKLGILNDVQMKSLDRDWAKYRKLNELDAFGNPKSQKSSVSMSDHDLQLHKTDRNNPMDERTGNGLETSGGGSREGNS